MSKGIRLVRAWEIRRGESPERHEMFKVFCEIKSESFTDLHRELKNRDMKAPIAATLKRYAESDDWLERRTKYIRYLNEKQQQSVDVEIKKQAPRIAQGQLKLLSDMVSGITDLCQNLLDRVDSAGLEIEEMHFADALNNLVQMARVIPRLIQIQREVAGLNHAEADVIGRQDLESMLSEIQSFILEQIPVSRREIARQEWFRIISKYLGQVSD